MNIEDVLSVDPGSELMVANETFFVAGYITVTLEGGDETRWMTDDDENLLIVHPRTEEVSLFHLILKDLEPEEDVVMFRGEQYTLSYEDEGTVTELVADVLSDVEDEFYIYEYESGTGDLVRIVQNETTDEIKAYSGKPVFLEDIYEV